MGPSSLPISPDNLLVCVLPHKLGLKSHGKQVSILAGTLHLIHIPLLLTASADGVIDTSVL